MLSIFPMAKRTITISGYLVFLYDFYNQYELHIRLEEGESPPSKNQMDGIVNYLRKEGFIEPPKKVHLAIVKFN